ncbi:MAG TPA: IS1634 family transposase [Candidatus Tectomicrobia bacterium]
MPQTYHSQILDHLGLVAGMFEELGIAESIDHATKQDPEMRIVTAGHAVKAMVLNGLGFVTQQLYLVPHFFRNKPTSRLIAPAIKASHLNDDTLGRALDTLYDAGVTELYSLIASTAARRLGLAPTFTHLDSTSFHVDGRYNSDEAPDEQVVHITQGYSRDHRPDLNQVMLELVVEHQAGIPVLMKPLSGNSSDGKAFGQVISKHIAQIQTTYHPTYLVADSALYSADNLQKLADTSIKWITRVPATLTEAQEVLTQANPQTMSPLQAGYRYRVVTSNYGDVAQRWVLIYSEQRQPQAQRTVDKQWLKQSDKEAKAFKTLCRTAFACAADAQQALARFAPDLQTTFLQASAVCPTPRYGKRGRPGPGAQPDEVVYHITGALASQLTARRTLVDQQSCFILATNELDASQLPPQAVLDGYKGQAQAERGFRFLKDPQFLASSLYLKKPERIMALLMVMTVCLLVYAALEYRIRNALKAHGATFPDQKGKRIPNPTVRWVFHSFVGIHVLFRPEQPYIVINLTEEHMHLLQLLGDRYAWFYR